MENRQLSDNNYQRQHRKLLLPNAKLIVQHIQALSALSMKNTMQHSSHLRQTYTACHDVCNLLFQIICRLTVKLLMNGNQLLPESLKIKNQTFSCELAYSVL